jgi:hypothetical protein
MIFKSAEQYHSKEHGDSLNCSEGALLIPHARGCTKRPGERAEEAKSEAGKYGIIEASEYKRSGKGGSYELTESVCQ